MSPVDMTRPPRNPVKTWVGDMFVKVITFNLASDTPDEPESERVINFSDPDARDWLSKHQFWAWANNRAIETVNIVDDKS